MASAETHILLDLNPDEAVVLRGLLAELSRDQVRQILCDIAAIETFAEDDDIVFDIWNALCAEME